MSYPRTPTTTTSAATTTPNETPNEPYDASPGTPTVWATPSASTPSKPPRITHRCFTHRYFRRRCRAVPVAKTQLAVVPSPWLSVQVFTSLTEVCRGLTFTDRNTTFLAAVPRSAAAAATSWASRVHRSWHTSSLKDSTTAFPRY